MRLLKKINYCLIYNIIIGIFIEDVTYVLLVKKYIKVFLVILLKICSIMYYDEKVMFSNNYPYDKLQQSMGSAAFFKKG